MKSEQKADRRIKRSKDALKKATLSLMNEKDFKTISITEIAERAGFNRGTFYAHYKSKEDIIADVVEGKMTELIKSLSLSQIETETILIDDVPEIVVSLFNHFWDNSNYYQLMLNQNVLPGFQDYFCETIINHFLKNIEYELTNPNHHINREIKSYYSAYSILGIVIYWIKDGLKYTPHYMAKQLVGISTNYPYKVSFKDNNYADK